MIVREASYADSENLSALSIYVWLNSYAKDGIRGNISKFVLNEFTHTKFKTIIDSTNKKVLVAVNEELLIGLAVIDVKSQYSGLPDCGYEICTLYVHPKFQRKGVGRELLNALHKKYGKKSWLTTWVNNENALSFYEKNGFKIIGKAEFTLLDESHVNHVLSNN